MWEWVKRNKLASILLLIVVFLVLKSVLSNSLLSIRSRGVSSAPFGLPSQGAVSLGAPVSSEKMSSDAIYPMPADVPPQPGVANRLVIQSSFVSLQVKDVSGVRKQIISRAQETGGYMVSSNLESPQESPTSTVVVRVPSAQLEQVLEYYRSLAIKVVSENLQGQDVTDEFVDIDKHIAILEQTKTKFESILTQAAEISDITNLNQQIIQIQSQIDSYRGQQESLKKNAEMAKLTIYLAADEIALPYAPSEAFRPQVIFKLAVRSLLANLQKLGALVIWIAVYAIIWVPVLIGVWYWRKRRNVQP